MKGLLQIVQGRNNGQFDIKDLDSTTFRKLQTYVKETLRSVEQKEQKNKEIN